MTDVDYHWLNMLRAIHCPVKAYLCVEFDWVDGLDKIGFGFQPWWEDTAVLIAFFVSFSFCRTGQDRTHKLLQCLFGGKLSGIDELIRVSHILTFSLTKKAKLSMRTITKHCYGATQVKYKQNKKNPSH